MLRLIKALAASLLVGVCLGYFTTLYMGCATVAYGLMISAMRLRRSARADHRALMYAAMAIDLSLVLILEFSRDAIGTVISMKLGPWQSAHVLASTIAVLLYVPMIIAGTKLWNSETPAHRSWHRRLGFLTFAFRTLGFLLMFSLLAKAAA